MIKTSIGYPDDAATMRILQGVAPREERARHRRHRARSSTMADMARGVLREPAACRLHHAHRRCDASRLRGAARCQRAWRARAVAPRDDLGGRPRPHLRHPRRRARRSPVPRSPTASSSSPRPSSTASRPCAVIGQILLDVVPPARERRCVRRHSDRAPRSARAAGDGRIERVDATRTTTDAPGSALVHRHAAGGSGVAALRSRAARAVARRSVAARDGHRRRDGCVGVAVAVACSRSGSLSAGSRLGRRGDRRRSCCCSALPFLLGAHDYAVRLTLTATASSPAAEVDGHPRHRQPLEAPLAAGARRHPDRHGARRGRTFRCCAGGDAPRASSRSPRTAAASSRRPDDDRPRRPGRHLARELAWPGVQQIYVHPVTVPIPSTSAGLVPRPRGRPDARHRRLRPVVPRDPRVRAAAIRGGTSTGSRPRRPESSWCASTRRRVVPASRSCSTSGTPRIRVRRRVRDDGERGRVARRAGCARWPRRARRGERRDPGGQPPGLCARPRAQHPDAVDPDGEGAARRVRRGRERREARCHWSR